MKVLALALILAGCGVVPKSIVNVEATREPFEFVAYGKNISDGQMLEAAMKHCKGATFTVTEYNKFTEVIVMYFTCKVGR